MKKLSILFAIVAMTTLGSVGCKTKGAKDGEPTDPAATKTTEPKPEPKTPDPVKPDDKKPEAPVAADLPAECNDYKAMIEKLSTCEKLPQASRDGLKQSYDTAAAAWANVPADGKAQMAATCKQGADALKQAAAAACGW